MSEQQFESNPEAASNSADGLDEESRNRLRDQIVESLKTVYDPEIPVDIYELGLIYELRVQEDA
ncbi:MAG TPA: iron-sulfur cluster assembly protein, partial [Acidobacteriota bacterium]|nr:iron-sulfur cluster assembly protein [Acidobacteriota bacterium]